MKKLLLLAVAFATFLLNATDDAWWQKPYIPAEQPIPVREKPLQKPESVEVMIPGVGLYQSGASLKRISLAGMWKFSGLETSELPFPSACPDQEKKFAEVSFDDSGWSQIKVPTNWWTVDKWKYNQIFHPSRKTNVKSQAYNRRTSNPYCKGWYRHTIDLGDRIEGRVVLEFHAIGYEAELYVNGTLCGTHHGDFHTWKPDITELVKPGRNLIALRVLADLGPHDEVYTHVYGAAWTNACIKGGLWDHVWLRRDASEFGIDGLRLVADSKGNLELHYAIRYHGEKPLTVTPGVGVNIAEEGTAAPPAREFEPITLKKGINEGVLKLKIGEVKPWSPDHPNLYFCTLYFRDGKNIRATRVERFGFRDFKVKGCDFYLNGKPIYLSIETAQSMRFSGDVGDPVDRIRIFKAKGVNMLRTAHQPVTPRLIEAADEMGMMIYDEWALGSFRNIVPELFVRRDLEELESFVTRDHNNPCVVMWLLGNEVEHRTNPHIYNLLNAQTALVRKLDLQKRPVTAFAGCGNLHHYGYQKLDTDVLDFHLYTGITRPALRWEEDFSRYVDMVTKVYGKDGKLDMPIVISEAIGGGWGHHPDRNYKHGNIDRYLEQMNRSYYWGNPSAAGYSGAVGIRSVLDPERQYKYIWCINGTRVVEMARQDPRIAGFGTWIGAPTFHSTRWTQPVYPGLRIAPDRKSPLLQFFAPGTVKLNAFLLNQGETELGRASVRIDLAHDGAVVPVATLEFGAMPPGARKDSDITLTLPELKEGRWELRLTLLDSGVETGGRNSYSVQLHNPAVAAEPIANASKLLLLGNHAGVKKILTDLQIPFDVFNGSQKYADYSCIVIPPGVKASTISARPVADWVNAGGRLLILEQEFGTLPVFGNYQLSADDNTMVETVVEAHPVFNGLVQADFDIWAQNPKANVIQNVIAPLDATALAVKGRFLDEKGAGNAVAEMKYGKGRAFFSQLLAVNLWKVNASATRYLRNVFAYLAATPDSGLWKDARHAGSAEVHDFPIAHERIFKIDLRQFANNSFADEVEGDGIGWTDQGPMSDMRNMPLGAQEGAGIPFTIIDPATNNGKSCITLTNGKMKLPMAVENIPVGRKVNSITFLHTAGFVGGNTVQAVYEFRYEDGSKASYPIVGGKNGGDWWNPAAKPEAIPCLIRKNGLGANVGFYAARWINPYPEKKVVSFSFGKEMNPIIPTLAAATAELVHEDPLPLLNFNDPHWACAADKGGTRGTVDSVKDPAGSFSRVMMPATTSNDGYSAAVLFLFYDKKKFENNTYDYLSFWYRSNDSGKVDVVIPQIEHKARRVHSFELQNSQGRWVRVRLHLEHDFLLEGENFDIHSMRPELIFYNGYNRKAGFPRKEVTFDIRGLRLE